MAVTRGLELKIPPMIVLIIAGFLMWIIARVTPQLMLLYPARGLLTALLAVLGVAAVYAGLREFGKASTTVHPQRPDEASSVVTSGIYRFTRNPMYLGMLLTLLAWLAWLANVAAAIVPVAFVVYITWYQIKPEERLLTDKFGAPYETYLRTVRRWI